MLCVCFWMIPGSDGRRYHDVRGIQWDPTPPRGCLPYLFILFYFISDCSIVALRAAVVRYAPIVVVTYRYRVVHDEPSSYVANRRLRRVPIVRRYVLLVIVTYRSHSLRTDRRSLRADRYVPIVTCRSYVPIVTYCFCFASPRAAVLVVPCSGAFRSCSGPAGPTACIPRSSGPRNEACGFSGKYAEAKVP